MSAKDKPQTITAKIDSGFFECYTEMLIPAIKRKFDVSIGIEGELLSHIGGTCEIIIRFLSTDRLAKDIFDYINEKWQFASLPELAS